MLNGQSLVYEFLKKHKGKKFTPRQIAKGTNTLLGIIHPILSRARKWNQIKSELVEPWNYVYWVE